MEGWVDPHTWGLVVDEEISSVHLNDSNNDLKHLKKINDREMTNTSGSTIAAGTICVQDTAAEDSVVPCTTASHGGPLWIALDSVAAGAVGYFRSGSTYANILITGAGAVGNTVQTRTDGTAEVGSTNWFGTLMTAPAGGFAVVKMKDQGTGTALTVHDHTGASGGVLTNDEHDGYSEYAEIAAPASPAANKIRVYAKDVSGATYLVVKDSAGAESVLAGGPTAFQAFQEGAVPLTPASGVVYVFADTDGRMWAIDDGGNQWLLAGGQYLDLKQQAAPGSPPTGWIRVYAKTDDLLYQKTDAGVETQIGSGGGGGGASSYLPNLGTLVPPAVGSFSWTNQGSATAVNDSDGVLLTAPADTGDNYRILRQALPGATFITTVGIMPHGARGVQYQNFGLCLLDTAAGGNVQAGVTWYEGGWTFRTVNMNQPDDPGAFSGTNSAEPVNFLAPLIFIQVEHTASNRIWRVGPTLSKMRQINLTSLATNDWVTPNAVGFFASSMRSNLPCAVSVVHWTNV